MKNKSNFLVFGILAVLLVLSSCASGGGGAAEELVLGPNMLVNGDFEAGQDPWTPWIDSGWGGAGAIIWEDGVARTQIEDPGTAPWAIAMHYKKVLIEKDAKYLIRFDAKADEPRVMRFSIGNGLAPADPPYLKYKDIELTTEWQTFEWEFKMIFRTNKFGRLDFNMATNEGAYLPEGSEWSSEELSRTAGVTTYIDNVELRKYVPASE